ncbi:MAG: hypothetical protein JO107_10150, partial [Hyphomicrobiales bacterium]|nr:hypothetical protein [Hyphomicrobiales bacterium]
LSDADAEIAAEICRRLDGIPLAIEFAAARISIFGLRGLRDRLKAGLRILRCRTRFGPPRHQSLRALMDWNFDLLSPAGQAVLRRLAVFSGCFTVEAAAAVASGAGLDSDGVVDQVIDLAQKSLIMAGASGEAMHYWLLETTHAYASEKLSESEEVDEVFGRYADWLKTGFPTVASHCGHCSSARNEGREIQYATTPRPGRTRVLDRVTTAEKRIC